MGGQLRGNILPYDRREEQPRYQDNLEGLNQRVATVSSLQFTFSPSSGPMSQYRT